MLITIIGNGSCETLYENRCIEIGGDVDIDTVQKYLDEWKNTLDDAKLDEFGDVHSKIVTLEELVEAMPPEWDAKLTTYVCEAVFI